jgi:hypothetical protein
LEARNWIIQHRVDPNLAASAGATSYRAPRGVGILHFS